MVLIISCATGSVTSLVPPPIQPYLAGATAVFGLIDVFFDLSGRAQKHAYQKEKYFEIASELKLKNPSVFAAQSAMTRLAGQEEPVYCVVHVLAERWANEALYNKEATASRPSFFKRMLRHYVRFDGSL